MRIKYASNRPPPIMRIVNARFNITESWIILPANGFLPTASTPLFATLPKYVNPTTNAPAASNIANTYRSEASGVKSEPTTLVSLSPTGYLGHW